MYHNGRAVPVVPLSITLVVLGQALAARAKGTTSKALRAHLDLHPPTANVVRDGSEHEIPAADVQVGDVVVVRPGDRIPVDGVVTDGDCRPSRRVSSFNRTGRSWIGAVPGIWFQS